jgi:hypothetical protein
MEVLGRGGRIRHPDIPLGGELEEALQSRARVFRALSLVAMRKEQREPRSQAPLGESGREELVHDHLGGIDEIAELRFPEDQGFRCHRAVPVLESEGGKLR